MIKSRHTGLVVHSIDRALGFYQYMLGLVVIKDVTESGKFISDISRGSLTVVVRTVKLGTGGEIFFELLEYKRPRPDRSDVKGLIRMGFSHVAFTVDNLDKLYNKLCNYGIRFLSCPKTSPDGKAKVCFCRDRDRNFVELVEEL